MFIVLNLHLELCLLLPLLLHLRLMFSSPVLQFWLSLVTAIYLGGSAWPWPWPSSLLPYVFGDLCEHLFGLLALELLPINPSLKSPKKVSVVYSFIVIHRQPLSTTLMKKRKKKKGEFPPPDTYSPAVPYLVK